MVKVPTRVRVLRKVSVGVKFPRPSHDIEVVGAEDELVRLVQVAGCHRDHEREEDREPEICRGPQIIVVPVHGSVEPPRRNSGIESLDARMSYSYYTPSERLLTV